MDDKGAAWERAWRDALSNWDWHGAVPMCRVVEEAVGAGEAGVHHLPSSQV